MKAVKRSVSVGIRLYAAALTVVCVTGMVAGSSADAQASQQPTFPAGATAAASSLKVKMEPKPATAAVDPGSAAVMQHEIQSKLAARESAVTAPRQASREPGAGAAVRRAGRVSPNANATFRTAPAMAAAAKTPAKPTAQPAGTSRKQVAVADATAETALGTPDTGLDALWNGYGNDATCADWSGGDGTDSVELPNGERAWFFSDTFLGSAAARKTLFDASTLHNSIVIQDGDSLSTITGGNTCEETNDNLSFWDRYADTPAAAPDASSGGFYWTGDQMVVGSNVVKFYYHGNHSVFPFAITNSAVATIPVSSLEGDTTMTVTPLEFTNLCTDSASGSSDIIWGSALLSWEGSVYVYGWSTTDSGALYLAKTTAADLTDPSTWETYAGLDSSGDPIWSGCGAEISPLPITLGSGLSVSAITGSSDLWLVQQDPGSGLVGGPIAAHPAAAPWLFNNNEVVLYYPPEEVHAYPYYYITYNAQVQAGLGSSGDVVISYNVNSTAVDTGCVSADVHDASIYRPRFIDVPTSAFSTADLTTAAVGSGTGLAAPSYGIQDYGPTDQASAPPVNQAGTVLSGGSGEIDGVSDWYDQWGSLDGGCPSYAGPKSLTAASPTPDGVVTLTWPTVGTDIWYWGNQRDVTTDSGESSLWGGLWAEPSTDTAATVSQTAAPVTTAAGNGNTYSWYVQPFAAGGQAVSGPTTNASPTASEAVSIQRPSAPTDVTASHGSGAESEFAVYWDDVTYPSSAVYYWIYYWNVTAGQTEADATELPDPAPPGSVSLDIEGLTATNKTILTPNSEYGFYIEAENLGGYSVPSPIVYEGPTPVCYFDDISSDETISFDADPAIYIYAEVISILPGDESQAMAVTNTGTNQTIDLVLTVLPTPAIAVGQFVETVDPPVPYKLLIDIQAEAPIAFQVTSNTCYGT
jgi:hypothetical protein